MIIADRGGILIEDSEMINISITGSDIVVPHSRVIYVEKVANCIYYDAMSWRAAKARLQIKRNDIDVYPLLHIVDNRETEEDKQERKDYWLT